MDGLIANSSGLLLVLPMMFAGASFVSACMLFRRSAGDVSKVTLGLACLAWCIVQLGCLRLLAQGGDMVSPMVRFDPSFLIRTLLAAEITLLYPFTLINPANMTRRRLLHHFGPSVVLGVSYFFYVISHPWASESDSLYSMATSLALGDGRADLVDFCFRVAIVGYIFLDTCIVLLKIKRFAPVYDRMVDENFSNAEMYDLHWIERVFFFNMITLALFVTYMIVPNLGVSLVIGSLHLFFLGIVVFMTVYSALGQVSLPASMYPRLRWNYLRMQWELPEREGVDALLAAEEESQDSLLSEQQVTAFKQVFDEWMRITKPYTKSDFRVSDVHKKLGIGRLETNEFFNRAYHCYFRNLVQQYRIEEAIRMMMEGPDKQIKEIAYEVGFSSQSVFARSFQNQMGMSCTRYRDKLMKGENS